MLLKRKQIAWAILALAMLIALVAIFIVIKDDFVWQTGFDIHSIVFEYTDRQEKARGKAEIGLPEIEDIIAMEEIEEVLFKVPFLVQAPMGEWNDPRFQDGCEEAALIMAWHWILGDEELTADQVRGEILDLIDWQIERHGNYVDTSATSTAQLMKDYYDYSQIEVKEIRGFDEIKHELWVGNLVIVPVDGRVISNSFYTSPGPERHMIVVIGYDDITEEFITNDAGTKNGAGYRYNYAEFFTGIRNYPTGDHLEIQGINKIMIVVNK